MTTNSVVAITVGERGARGPQGPQGPQGAQGPQGPQGVPGASGVQAIQGTAGGVIALNRVLSYDNNGKLVHADNSVLQDFGRVIGLSMGTAATDAVVDFTVVGPITNPAWNWVQGPVFLGTDGNLTQIAPTVAPAVFYQVIGQALTPTSIFVNVQIPVLLNT